MELFASFGVGGKEATDSLEDLDDRNRSRKLLVDRCGKVSFEIEAMVEDFWPPGDSWFPLERSGILRLQLEMALEVLSRAE